MHRLTRFAISQEYNRLFRISPVDRISTTRRFSINDRPSYIHNPGKRPLQYETIGRCLQKAANSWPNRTFLVSHNEGPSMTFSQVLEEADKLAAGLVDSGLQPGDKLGICCPNSMRWITTMMAATRAGLVVIAINPAYQNKELEFCINKVGIKALAVASVIKNQDYYGMLRSIAPELGNCVPGQLNCPMIPNIKTIIMLDDKKLDGVLTYTEVMSRRSTSSTQFISENIRLNQADSGFVQLFTSGTTGQPKAALLSHLSYVNNSWEVGVRNELSVKEHKLCLQVPLFHAFGLLTAMACLQHGTTMVIPGPAYNVENAVQAIAQERCTIVTGTPTMYVDLINYQRSRGGLEGNPGAPIRGLEIATTSGAPCSGPLGEQIRDHLGVKSIKSLYGMTEACVMFQNVQGDDIFKSTDTVGQLMRHAEAKIVDAKGLTVAMGTPGELCIRSYANMQEYFEDPEKTADAISPDKWLRTGDQFILQEDGYGKVSGRLKDIIIRGGENISPKEIEDLLNTHPDIIESHVFGVKDDRLGEEICASVRLREGAQLELHKIKSFCQGTIANFKIPRLLKIVEKFPLTPSGKIQKFKLKEMVESGQI